MWLLRWEFPGWLGRHSSEARNTTLLVNELIYSKPLIWLKLGANLLLTRLLSHTSPNRLQELSSASWKNSAGGIGVFHQIREVFFRPSLRKFPAKESPWLRISMK